MILGIGTDVVDIGRFVSYPKTSRVLARIFTPEELAYCFSKKFPAPHLAVRFAAKEAVTKAVSTLSSHTISYKNIEITNSSLGVPRVSINNRQLARLQVHISLSHSQSVAMAFVLLQSEHQKSASSAAR